MRSEYAIALLGAAALAGLTFAQAATLLPSCGVLLGSIGVIDFCPRPNDAEETDAIEREADRSRDLAARIRRLERRLAGLPACRPDPAPPPEPPPPPPELPRAATPPPDPERLDPEKWEDKDVSLLEGCWSLSSDYRLRNTRTRVVTAVDTWEICFDANGRGRQTLVQTDGMRCEGPMRARFRRDGRLRIDDVGDLPCTGNIIVHERRMTCELEAGGEAACVATQEETGSRSNVRITRRASR